MYNVRPCRTSAEGGGGEPFLIANYGIWGVYSTTTTQIPTDTTDPNGQSGKAKVFPSTSRATGWPLWWLTYHRWAKDVKRIHLALWTWWDCICICIPGEPRRRHCLPQRRCRNPARGGQRRLLVRKQVDWKWVKNRGKFHRYGPCLGWYTELLNEWPGGTFTRTEYPTSSQSTEVALFWSAPSGSPTSGWSQYDQDDNNNIKQQQNINVTGG